jgi:hypothetical protein
MSHPSLKKYSVKKDIFLITVLLMPLATISGLRNNGPDYPGYLTYFNRFETISEYFYSFFYQNFDTVHREPFFYGLMYIFKSLGASYGGFLLFWSLLSGILLIYFIKDRNNRLLSFIVYVSLIYLYFNTWYLRQGVAYILLFMGLNKNTEKRNGYKLIILSFLTHLSTVMIYFGIFLLKYIPRNIKFAFLGIFYLLYLANFSLYNYLVYIEDYMFLYKHFLNDKWTITRVGVTFIPLIMFFIYKFFVEKQRSAELNYLFDLTFLIFSTACLFYGIPGMGRFTGITMLFVYFLSVGLITFNKNNLEFKVGYICFIFLLAIKEFVRNFGQIGKLITDFHGS